MWSSLRCKWHFWWQCLWAYSVLSNLRHNCSNMIMLHPQAELPSLARGPKKVSQCFFSIWIFQLVTFFLDVVSWWTQKTKNIFKSRILQCFVAFPPKRHIFKVFKQNWYFWEDALFSHCLKKGRFQTIWWQQSAKTKTHNTNFCKDNCLKPRWLLAKMTLGKENLWEKLVQNLTFKTTKIGPEPRLTGVTAFMV